MPLASPFDLYDLIHTLINTNTATSFVLLHILLHYILYMLKLHTLHGLVFESYTNSLLLCGPSASGFDFSLFFLRHITTCAIVKSAPGCEV